MAIEIGFAGGTVEAVSCSGTIEAASTAYTIDVETGIISGHPYSGEYDVIPSAEPQTLSTAGKTLARDVRIAPIPDNYGRIAWNGSALLVY